MLKVTIPPYYFNEKKYIVAIIFKEFLSLEYILEVGVEHYEILLENQKKIVFKDGFFKKFSKVLHFLTKSAIPEQVQFTTNPFIPEADLPIIYGGDCLQVTDDAIICGIDIFASIFFMLSRWEEYANKTRDQHNRFPATASLAYKHNFLLRPVVNEYVEMLWNMLKALGYQEQRKQRKFEIKVSHDVDSPFLPYHLNYRILLRVLMGDILKRKSLLNAARKLVSTTQFKFRKTSHDAFNTFDFIMNVSEENNLISHFYFLADNTNSLYDGYYYLQHHAIRKLMQSIANRGHCIGLHTSYETYLDAARVKKEFTHLKHSCCKLNIQQSEFGGRQHYLRWTVPDTWQGWSDAGLSYDSTLGYADYSGFRCGVCYPFTVFNILTQKHLPLVEIPLIVMDCSVTDSNYMGLGFTQHAQDFILKLEEKCQKYNGVFTLLWHNSHFTDPDGFLFYQNLLHSEKLN